jgi:hypothetical protein
MAARPDRLETRAARAAGRRARSRTEIDWSNIARCLTGTSPREVAWRRTRTQTRFAGSRLEQLGVPYLFATAYNELEIPERYRAAPVCEKPVSLASILDTLDRISSRPTT